MKHRITVLALTLACSLAWAAPPKDCICPVRGDIVPGHLLVKVKPGHDGKPARDRAKAKVKKRFLSGAELWEIPEGLNPSEVAADPAILYAEPDTIVTIDRVPNDPLYPHLYGMTKISAPAAWDVTTGSTEVVIGVVDSGIDYTHPDLAANIWTNPGEVAGNGLDDDNNGYVDDVHGYDFVKAGDSDPIDDNLHGTHTAGTVGAVGNNAEGVTGVAWTVRLAALKGIGCCGSGQTSDLIEALDYATRMGFAATNNSWAGSFSQTMLDTLTVANQAGVGCIASAGNAARDTDISPQYPANYPLDNIISVGATDSSDAIASFSNFGATSVDLFAPGVEIESTFLRRPCGLALGGTYAFLSGTSMSAPHVTGAYALVKALHPEWGAGQIKTAIMAGADPLPNLAGKCVTGGRLNVARALGGMSTTVCGDGRQDAGEGCDDGNTAAGDGCSASCAVETGWVCTGASPSRCGIICGDGICLVGQDCLTCRADCPGQQKKKPSQRYCCGDGVRQSQETEQLCDGNF